MYRVVPAPPKPPPKRLYMSSGAKVNPRISLGVKDYLAVAAYNTGIRFTSKSSFDVGKGRIRELKNPRGHRALALIGLPQVSPQDLYQVIRLFTSFAIEETNYLV
jgi:hypothetical protein